MGFLGEKTRKMRVDHRIGNASQLPGAGVNRGFILVQEISTD